MYFLSPQYLWALLGLAIPIAIHLWSKKEGKTIKIGSIQLIKQADSKQTSSIRINEFWLLLLRVLMLCLLVLIISEPRLKQKEVRDSITYLIEPSLLKYEKVVKIIDTINPDKSIKVLQNGFPELDRENLTIYSEQPPNYWQLAKEMKELNSDSIVVFTNAFLSGIKGKRPSIQNNINWIFLDPGVSQKSPFSAIKKGEEIEVTTIVNTSERVSFETENVPFKDLDFLEDSINFQNNTLDVKIPIRQNDRLFIELLYSDDFIESGNYIESAFKAIGKYLDREVKIHKFQNKDSLELKSAHAIIWLNEEAFRNFKIPTLAYRPDSLSNSLIELGTFENEWFLTEKLNSENIIEGNLAENLIEFLDLNKDLKEEVAKYDKRIFPRADFLPNEGELKMAKNEANTVDITHWFWFLLLPVLISERFLAKYRKQ